jgi:trehalose 6-phosphate phosphatase
MSPTILESALARAMTRPAFAAGAQRGWSLFLHVDGTLLDFADSPGGVEVPAGLAPLLRRVSESLNCAVALISGRSVPDLDQLLSPLRLPCAALHGVERRDAGGQISRCPVDYVGLDRARRAVHELLEEYPEVELEDKRLAIALHFRRKPHLGSPLRRSLHALIRVLGPTLTVQDGTYVLEVKPSAGNISTALEAFMAEPPFAGRRPICVGDRLADSHAFRAVHRHGGLAIAVGMPVHSPWQLPDPHAVQGWLEGFAALHRGTGH